jgi:competence protein ComEC
LYTIVTDAEPPAVRATILVLIVALAFCLGRRPLAFNSLAAAGLVVLVMNPTDLFRTGVQLSFLCAGGLMWFAPRLTLGSPSQHPLAELTRRSRPWPVRLVARGLHWAWQLTCLGALL